MEKRRFNFLFSSSHHTAVVTIRHPHTPHTHTPHHTHSTPLCPDHLCPLSCPALPLYCTLPSLPHPQSSLAHPQPIHPHSLPVHPLPPPHPVTSLSPYLLLLYTSYCIYPIPHLDFMNLPLPPCFDLRPPSLHPSLYPSLSFTLILSPTIPYFVSVYFPSYFFHPTPPHPSHPSFSSLKIN